MCKFQLPIHFDEKERARLTTPPDFSVRNFSIPDAGLGAWTTARPKVYCVRGVLRGGASDQWKPAVFLGGTVSLCHNYVVYYYLLYTLFICSSLGNSTLVRQIFFVIMLSGRK